MSGHFVLRIYAVFLQTKKQKQQTFLLFGCMQISVSQMTQISQISDLRKGKNIRLVTTHPCQDKESPPQPLKIKLGKLIRSETLLYCREGQHTWPPHHQKMCSPHFKYGCFVKPIFWAIIRHNRCFFKCFMCMFFSLF